MLFEKIKLDDDEDILLIVRRHWFVLLIRMLSVVLTAIAPFFILLLANIFPQTQNIFNNLIAEYAKSMIFLGSAWLLINWMMLAYIWTDHYLDLWVVTDHRVISIDQKSLFIRTVSSFRLERLQDMRVTIAGFLATILDYGTIQAQTASESENNFTVGYLPNPRNIKSIITEATDNRLRQIYDSPHI